MIRLEKAFIASGLCAGHAIEGNLSDSPRLNINSEDTESSIRVLDLGFRQEFADSSGRPLLQRVAVPAPFRPTIDGFSFTPPHISEGHFADIILWVPLAYKNFPFVGELLPGSNRMLTQLSIKTTLLSPAEVTAVCSRLNWPYFLQGSTEIIMSEQTPATSPAAVTSTDTPVFTPQYPAGMISRTTAAEHTHLQTESRLSGTVNPLGSSSPISEVGLHCLVDSASLVCAVQSAISTKLALLAHAHSLECGDAPPMGAAADALLRRDVNSKLFFVAGMDGMRVGFITNKDAGGFPADVSSGNTRENADSRDWFATTILSWYASPARDEDQDAFGLPLPFRPWAAAINAIPDMSRSGALGIDNDIQSGSASTAGVTEWQNLGAMAELMDMGLTASLPEYPVCLVSFYQEALSCIEVSAGRRTRGEGIPETLHTKVVLTFLKDVSEVSDLVDDPETTFVCHGDPLAHSSLRRIVFETSCAPSVAINNRQGAGMILPYFPSQATSRCYLGDCFGKASNVGSFASHTLESMGGAPAWLMHGWMLMGRRSAGICKWPTVFESWDRAKAANVSIMEVPELRMSVFRANVSMFARAMALAGRKYDLEKTSVSLWWEDLGEGARDLLLDVGGWKTSLNPQEESLMHDRSAPMEMRYHTFPDDISVSVKGFRICRVMTEESSDRGVATMLKTMSRSTMAIDLYSPPLQRVTGVGGGRAHREGNGMGLVVLKERGTLPSVVSPMDLILPAVPLVGVNPVDQGSGMTYRNLQDPTSIVSTFCGSSVLSQEEVDVYIKAFSTTQVTHLWRNLPCSLEAFDRCNRESDFLMISRNGYCRFVSGGSVSDRMEQQVEFGLRNLVVEVSGQNGEDRFLTGLLIPMSLFRETREVLAAMGAGSRCRIWLQKTRRDRLASRSDAAQEGTSPVLFQGIDLGVGRLEEGADPDWRNGDYDLSFKVVVCPPGDHSILSNDRAGIRRGVFTKYFPALRLLASTDSLVPYRQ